MSDLAEGRIVEGTTSQLGASREQLEIILRNVAEGVTVTDPDGAFLYANEIAARTIGVDSVEELMRLGHGVARSRFDLFGPDGAPMPPEDLPGRRALADGRPHDAVIHFRSAGGGEERVSVVRAVPVLDDEGAVRYVINFFREVTDERRRIARESFLVEAGEVLGSSLRHEATLRAVTDLVVPRLADVCLVDLLDEDGGLRRVAATYLDPEIERAASERARRKPTSFDDATGPGATVRTGRSSLVLDADELRACVCVPIAVRGQTLGALTLGLTQPHRRFAEGDLEFAEDLARRVATAIDNSVLFRETRRSEALLDALFASAPIGLGFWDRDLRFVRVNRALADMNGADPEDHVGRTLEEVLPDLGHKIVDVYRRVIATGEPAHDIDVYGETPARPGVRRSWLGSYYPIRDAEGEVVGMGAVVLETTDRRRADQRLRVQYAVTRILAEARTTADALPHTLEAIAQLFEWDVGAYWRPDPGTDEATCEFIYAAPGLEPFAEATLGHRVRPGVSLAGEIWARGGPFWIPDLSTRDDVPQTNAAAELGITSGFGFPALVGGGEVVGILEFFARDAREPDPELLDVVGALGNNVGQFIERQRLFEREQRARAAAETAAATLARLAQVTEAALSHMWLRDLLDSLLARVVDVLAADSAAILLLDGETSLLTVRASVGLENELALAVPIPLGEGLAGTVASSRMSRLVDDLDEIDLVSPVLRARGIRSLVAIPLVVEDDVIGVFHAGSTERAHFAPEDARLLELIADRLALAISQAALSETERETQERLAFLGEASAVLASSLEFGDPLARVAELAVPRLADWCAVDVVADDGTIERVAVAHADKGKVDLGWKLVARHPLQTDAERGVPRVIRTREPELVADLTPEALDEFAPELRDTLLELGVCSRMIVPLVARGRGIGALSFAMAESGRRFGNADLVYAQELAARAAVAVDNARLYRESSESRDRLAFLAEASGLLASALDAETALERLGTLVVGRIADWCSIHLVDEHGLPRLVTIAHADPTKADEARAYAAALTPSVNGPHGVGHVVRSGESELWPIVPAELLGGPVREAGVHSCLIVPLRARGRTLGALTLVRAETPAAFGEADLRFAEDLGRRAGVAVDNAQLYREAAERAQAARVLASVGDGVMLVDRLGFVRYWNRAAASITGLAREQVIDRPVAEAIPGWAAVSARIPIAAEGTTNPRAESLPLALGHRELWLSTSGVDVVDGVVYAFRDLTEERALDEMKTEFVSTVSHELRTPLAAIYGAAMTLRREDVALGEEQRDVLLSVIANEADRLARTVNDILYASRIDTDTLKVAIESCDAAALATDVVEAQLAHLPPGIDVQLTAEEGLAPVAADPDKVRQVLVNLVENAVKYSPDGGRVQVELTGVGAQVRFSVADEGLGIPHAEQRRIFEKFYRLDPNMTRGIGGTGLGLYICRELVRRMHGRIWVESETGRGSTFTFELPIAGTDAEVTAHARIAF